jgi:hypothetical protein
MAGVYKNFHIELVYKVLINISVRLCHPYYLSHLESSQVAWAKEVTDREVLTFKRLTPKAIENLIRNAGLRRDCKLKLEPVEETLLIFDPENIKAVAERFNDKNNMLFLYSVIDPETSGIDLKASRGQVYVKRTTV